MKISTIVPIFNAESHLRRCLESIINQTFKDIEIICVDDGSTDASKEIVRQYIRKDERVKLIVQENLGVESARAAALNTACGDLIHFCDSDDWICASMYEKMHNSLIDSNADLSICNTAVFNARGVCDISQIKHFSLGYNGLQRIDDVMNSLKHVLWNKLFRAKIINDNGIKFPYNTRIRRGYDSSFVLQYFFSSKTAVFIKDFLYNYSRSNDGLTSKLKIDNDFILHSFYCLPSVYKFIESNNLSLDAFKRFLDAYFKIVSYPYISISDANMQIKIEALRLADDFFNSIDAKFGDGKQISKNFISYILLYDMNAKKRDKNLCLKCIENTKTILDELKRLNIECPSDEILDAIRTQKYKKAYKLPAKSKDKA